MTASEYSRAIFKGNTEAIPPPFGITPEMNMSFRGEFQFLYLQDVSILS
jgi:hypothetical protein